MNSNNPKLVFNDVTVRFGGVRALSNVSFDIKEGEICGLIGPNGAGKSTLLNTVSRFQNLFSGNILLNSVDIKTALPRDLVHKGVARTFQHSGMFGSMSVYENVLIGASSKNTKSFKTRFFGIPPHKKVEEKFHQKTLEILNLLGIQEIAHETVSDLPFGAIKKVELARALASEPDLLLLDEPAGGLVRGDVEELSALISFLHESLRLTVVVVEHNMSFVTSLCQKLVVLDHGAVLAEGSVKETLKNEAVSRAYFGGKNNDDS